MHNINVPLQYCLEVIYHLCNGEITILKPLKQLKIQIRHLRSNQHTYIKQCRPSQDPTRGNRHIRMHEVLHMSRPIGPYAGLHMII